MKLNFLLQSLWKSTFIKRCFSPIWFIQLVFTGILWFHWVLPDFESILKGFCCFFRVSNLKFLIFTFHSHCFIIIYSLSVKESCSINFRHPVMRECISICKRFCFSDVINNIYVYRSYGFVCFAFGLLADHVRVSSICKSLLSSIFHCVIAICNLGSMIWEVYMKITWIRFRLKIKTQNFSCSFRMA